MRSDTLGVLQLRGPLHHYDAQSDCALLLASTTGATASADCTTTADNPSAAFNAELLAR
jgi:hypothetical protein